MRWVWMSGLLALVLSAAITVYLWPLSPGVLALQFAWSPRTFGEIGHLWPPEDLERYRRHLVVDHVLLLSYAAFGWLLATRTHVFEPLGRAGRAFARMCLPLAAAFDAAENAFHAWLTEVPRFDTPLTYLLSTACSSLKWALLFVFAALLLWACARGED